MHAIDFLNAHRFAFSGLVFWLVINAQAVKFMSRVKDTFDPPLSASDGMSATIRQHP
jgi:hypothetical protein